MDKVKYALTSKAFWLLVVAYLVANQDHIIALLPSGWATAISGILGLLAVYSHTNVVNNLGGVPKTSPVKGA